MGLEKELQELVTRFFKISFITEKSSKNIKRTDGKRQYKLDDIKKRK